MTPTISSLLSRVRAASGPDRELDADLWWELEHTNALRAYHAGSTGKPTMVKDLGPGMGRASVRAFAPRLTASIDAAVALVERVLSGCHRWYTLSLVIDNGTSTFCIANREHGPDIEPFYVTEGHEASAPLAILAALLSALEQKESDDDPRT